MRIRLYERQHRTWVRVEDLSGGDIGIDINTGFTCAIYFTINVYYGCLYAYTPEVLPSAHRATGYGIAIGFNRIMGLVSAFVATYANTATSAPIYLCAALYIAMVSHHCINGEGTC